MDAAHSRRIGYRERVHMRAVRRDGGVEPGDVFGDRQRGHPGNAQARLLTGLRRGDHRRGRHARHSAAAVDHDDSLRGRIRTIAGSALPRRHRTRHPARRALRRVRIVSLSQGVQGCAKGVRRARPPLRLSGGRDLHVPAEGRDAATRPALRRSADRRDGRSVRRIRDAVRDRGPRCRPRAGAYRTGLQRLAPIGSETDPRFDHPRIDDADVHHRHVAAVFVRDELPAHQPVGGGVDRLAAPVEMGLARRAADLRRHTRLLSAAGDRSS